MKTKSLNTIILALLILCQTCLASRNLTAPEPSKVNLVSAVEIRCKKGGYRINVASLNTFQKRFAEAFNYFKTNYPLETPELFYVEGVREKNNISCHYAKPPFKSINSQAISFLELEALFNL